jgi:PAS domain S-box-containing protein
MLHPSISSFVTPLQADSRRLRDLVPILTILAISVAIFSLIGSAARQVSVVHQERVMALPQLGEEFRRELASFADTVVTSAAQRESNEILAVIEEHRLRIDTLLSEIVSASQMPISATPGLESIEHEIDRAIRLAEEIVAIRAKEAPPLHTMRLGLFLQQVEYLRQHLNQQIDGFLVADVGAITAGINSSDTTRWWAIQLLLLTGILGLTLASYATSGLNAEGVVHREPQTDLSDRSPTVAAPSSAKEESQRTISRLSDSINIETTQPSFQFDLLPVAILVTDANGFCTEANSEWSRLWNISRETLQGTGWVQPVHQDHRAQVLTGWEQAVRTKSPFQESFRIHVSGTTFKWVTVSASPVFDQHGKLQRYVATAVDITTVKESAAQVIEQNTRFQAVVETALDGIIVITERGIIESANPAVEKLFGYRPDEIIGKNISMLMPEPHRSAHDGYLSNYLGGATRKAVGTIREVTGLSKTGVQFPLELAVSEMRDANGVVRLTGIVHDVSNQKSAEAKLAAAVNRMQSILEAASEVAIVMTDVSGEIQLFNRGAQKLLGIDTAEVVGKRNFVDFLDPYDVADRAKELHKETGRVIAGFETLASIPNRDGVENRTWTYLSANQRKLLVNQVVTIVRDTNGAATGYLIVGTDISELRQAVFAHMESEQRFRHLANHVPVAIWKSCANGEPRFFNQTFLDLSNDTLESRLQKPLSADLHPDDIAVWDEAIRQAQSGRTAVTVECRRLRCDGTYRWIHETIAPRFLDDGSFAGLIGCGADVTERKAALTQLKATEERFELAVKGSNDVIWDFNLESQTAYFSPRFTEILGIEADQTPQTFEDFADMMHPAERDKAKQAWNRHLSNFMPVDIEHRLRTAAGEYRWFRTRGQSVVSPTGAVIRFAGASTDISEQKLAHQTLLRFATDSEEARMRFENQAHELSLKAEELEFERVRAQEASRSKSAFLANMSHEIRTPLNAVLGMTDLVLQDQLCDEHRNLLQTVMTSGEHLLTLLNDILDFSKIEAGKLAVDETEFDLARCLTETTQMFKLMAAKKGIACELVSPANLPHMVKGDVGRLRQILINLLGNAIKFTSKGSVTLRASCRSEPNKIVLTCEIIDTGIGIDQDKLGLLFRPFEQIDASTTRQYGGTGLGLAIVRRLIELLGGQLHVESIPGQGSTFTFSVRLTLTQPVSTSDDSGTAAAATHHIDRSLRVLVAEDVPVNQKLVQLLLERQGHQALLASNGQAAVDIVKQDKHVDLILMDMQMPILDGCAAAKQIRELELAENRLRLPIIALTANAASESRDECYQAGMDAFVTKPIRKADLFDTMERLLSRSVVQPETQASLMNPELRAVADLLA